MAVLEDLREQRSGLMAELETLNKESKLSDEQRSRWDAVETEITALDGEIERRARQAEREKRAATDRAERSGGQRVDITNGSEQRSSGWTVGNEPQIYGKGSRNSYFLDLARSELNRGEGHGGPTAARDRLRRHAQEIDVELPKRQLELDRRAEQALQEALMSGSSKERRAAQRMYEAGLSPFERRFVSRTDGAGGYFVPPLWLIDEYIPYLRAGREHADLARQLPLPGGTDNINIPRVTIGSATGPQVADGGPVPGRDMTDNFVSAPVRTIAGQQDAALQLLDQSPITFDEVIFQDLTNDYNMQLDGQTLVGSGVAGQIAGVYPAGAISSSNQIVVQNTNTNASQTWVANGGSGDTLFLSSGKLLSQGARTRLMPFDRWVWNPTLWYMLLSTLDSQNRPLVVPGGEGSAFNQAAMDDDGPLSEGVAGIYYGLPVTLSVNMPLTFGGAVAPQITTVSNGTFAPTPGSGTNANYTPMLAERTSDLFLWEGEMRTRVLSEVLSGNLQIRFQVYNYVAYMTNRYQSYSSPGQVVSYGSVFTGSSSNFNPLLNPVNLGF
jgi:HK97 family phage major capsid protein